MTAPRFARGTKSRIFLYVGILAFVGIAVCIFHETQSRMDDVRKSAEKCQQQQESLAAQLQVIFEYKLRLEKSVQQEKAEHRHTREELQAHLEEERARRGKEVLEATNKLASLQQHCKLLQGQHEDLAEECSKARTTATKAAEGRARAEAQLLQLRTATDKDNDLLKNQLMQLRAENERLVKQAQEAVHQGQQAASLASTLRTQNLHLHSELSQAKQALQSCPGYSSKASIASAPVGGHLQSPQSGLSSSSSSPLQPAALAVEQQGVLHQPNSPDKPPSSPTSAQKKSSTSTNSNSRALHGGNSQVAPVPAPGPPEQDSVGAKPSTGQESQMLNDGWHHLPAGVVPAPNVYHDNANFAPMDLQGQLLAKLRAQHAAGMRNDQGIEESHQIGQPFPPGPLMPQHHAALFNGEQEHEAEEEEEGDEAKAVGAAPPEEGEHKIAMPAWKAQGVGEEEEEGGEAVHIRRPGQVFRQYHAQNKYKEEEGELDERGAGAMAVRRWPVENQQGEPGEHAPGEPHEDLQLEDVEEDDDDDVDQIDYGNEVLNNGIPKQKQARKPPVVAKHESVMVNPK